MFGDLWSLGLYSVVVFFFWDRFWDSPNYMLRPSMYCSNRVALCSCFIVASACGSAHRSTVLLMLSTRSDWWEPCLPTFVHKKAAGVVPWLDVCSLPFDCERTATHGTEHLWAPTLFIFVQHYPIQTHCSWAFNHWSLPRSLPGWQELINLYAVHKSSKYLKHLCQILSMQMMYNIFVYRHTKCAYGELHRVICAWDGQADR